jgi:hypothetical protein
MPICNACEILKYDQLVNAKTRETGIRIYPPNPFPSHTCDELKETQYESSNAVAKLDVIDVSANEEHEYEDYYVNFEKARILAKLDNEDSEVHCITRTTGEKCVAVFSNPSLPSKNPITSPLNKKSEKNCENCKDGQPKHSL